MKKEYKIIIIGFLAITLFDIIGSITSSKFNYPYINLWPISLIIYISIPVFVTIASNFKTGMVTGSLLGLFDSTIGWKISMLLGANTVLTYANLSNKQLVAMIIIVTLYSTFIGLMASWLTIIFTKKNR
jgi:hypothetical protein